jgi:two-component system, sensor histidine kinase and response regulator
MDRIKKKILLIDDVEENIIVLRERLENEGYEIISATDGKTGIALADQEIPELIICDIMMPSMNGYEVMEMIHNNERTKAIPFIFLTAKADIQDIRQGMQSGADDYIAKPFDSKQLIKAVEARLTRKEIFESRTEEIKQSISYALPHELQTPLTAIMGFTSLLIEDYNQIERSKILELAEDIQKSAKRLNNLIQKILFSSNLDFLFNDPAHLREIKRHTVINPKKIITESAINTAKKFGREGDLEFEVDNANLYFSEQYLKTIISELIDNAMKYSPGGTRVKVTGVENESEYSLYIIDNGRGISDKQIEQLGEFIQFERKNYEQSGAGLGISIVRKLTKLYDGEFYIESVLNKQTMVKLIFRIKKENGIK